MAGMARATRRLSGSAGALLVTFHGWLLASQFLDGQLSHPGMALRWIAAAVLVAALLGVRRQEARFFSRKSVAVWALAALLHVPAVADRYGDAWHKAALPETVPAAVLQIMSASAALALVIWLRGAPRVSRIGRRKPHAYSPLRTRSAGMLLGDFSPPFSPRPPPLR